MPFSITKFCVIKCEEGLINSCLSIIDHQKKSAAIRRGIDFLFRAHNFSHGWLLPLLLGNTKTFHLTNLANVYILKIMLMDEHFL